MVSTIIRGGCGNNLFQMATCIAHSVRHNVEYAIPLEIENPHYEGQKPYIFPGVNYCDKLPDLPLYKELNFHYDPIPFMDNVILDGYWQSFRYFDDYKDDILKAFGFKWEMKKNYVAVHVRRGDYLKLPDHHPVVTTAYLYEAMMNIMTRVQDSGAIKFLVFSNDMPWCKETFSSGQFKSFSFEYAEGGSEIDDLVLGSCCEHQILSNGTFALWQYWLNQNLDKICIAPQVWFGKLMPHDTKDLYPPKAVII